MGKNKLLPDEFFLRKSDRAARQLLGKIIIHRTKSGRISGRIVETEAYGEADPASHAFCGRTARNSVMFGPSGRTYVYFTYGMHHCFNIVTDRDGRAGAVLIRAVEPREGIALMQKNRQSQNNRRRKNQNRSNLTGLTNGPAKFAQAFGFDRRHNNLSVRGPEVMIVDNHPVDHHRQSFKIKKTVRIGIKPEKKPKLWRYYIQDNPFVSKPQKGRLPGTGAGG